MIEVGTRVRYSRLAVKTFKCPKEARGTVRSIGGRNGEALFTIKWDGLPNSRTAGLFIQEIPE